MASSTRRKPAARAPSAKMTTKARSRPRASKSRKATTKDRSGA
jgi:hypothetical protein